MSQAQKRTSPTEFIELSTNWVEHKNPVNRSASGWTWLMWIMLILMSHAVVLALGIKYASEASSLSQKALHASVEWARVCLPINMEKL